MADEKVVLELTLDDKEYIEKLLRAKKSLKELGDKKNTASASIGIEDLTKKLKDLGAPDIGVKFASNFLKLAGPVAVVTTAVAGLKTAFDSALEGERIKAADAQFQQLASNMGLNASKIKQELSEAADGEVSLVQQTKLANEAMIKLGDSAGRIPEIMALAKQRSLVLGESVSDSFTQITNAVASGSERALRQLGLSVDTKKAVQDYAKELGVAVSALSEAGKKQAIMNAALDAGKAKFSGINDSIAPLNNSVEKLGAAYEDLSNWIKTSVSNLGLFKDAVDLGTKVIRNLGDDLKVKFGTEAEAAGVKVRELKEQIAQLEENLAQEAPQPGFFSKLLGLDEAGVEKIRGETQKLIDEKKAQIADLEKVAESGKPAGVGGGATSKTSDIDLQAQKEQQSKFEQELLQMRQSRIDAEIQLAANQTQLEQAEKDKRLVMEEEYTAQVAQIKLSDTTEMQKFQLIEEAKRAHEEKLTQFERDGQSRREAMLKNYQTTATSVMDGIARAAQVSAQQQTYALTNAGKAGQMAFDNLGKIGFAAFDALGRGAATGANEIGKAMLSTIGNIASNYGQMMMLSSLFPFNPAVFAAGAALVALGGFLGGAASGGSGPSPEPTSPTEFDKGPMAAPRESRTNEESPMIEEAHAKKTVNLVVQGNIYETDQTRQRLVELIREASDATDFRYNQIG